MGAYVSLNNCSVYKPNQTTPYQISEWYSYCHSCACNVFCLAYSASDCSKACSTKSACGCCIRYEVWDDGATGQTINYTDCTSHSATTFTYTGVTTFCSETLPYATGVDAGLIYFTGFGDCI